MTKRRALVAFLTVLAAALGVGGVSALTVGLAAAQAGPPPGFNPYGSPINGCDNPILAADTSGWGSDTAGASGTRGQPGDHIVANWDFNLHTTGAGNARIWMPQRNVVAGQTWEFGADVRTDNDPAAAAIAVDWFNGATQVSSQTGATVAIPGTRPYTWVAGTFTVPAGATVAHVLVNASQLNASSGFATTMCTYRPGVATLPPTTTVPPTTVPPTTVPPTTVPPTTVPPTTNPPPPTGTQVFNGDFETGNFSQYPLCQTRFYNNACSGMPANYPLTIEHPGHQGNSQARFEVRDGDQPFCCGERAQLVGPSLETEGKEYWYDWDVNVDPTFPTSSSWQVLMQWHSEVDGSPPLNFLAEGNNLVLETRPRPNTPYTGITNIWTTPLNKGSWHDIKVHVKWSANASVGFVELWQNGVRQTFTTTPPENSNGVCAGTQTCHIRNIYPGDPGNRSMVTYYRDAAIDGTGVVHHDNFNVAT